MDERDEVNLQMTDHILYNIYISTKNNKIQKFSQMAAGIMQ